MKQVRKKKRPGSRSKIH